MKKIILMMILSINLAFTGCLDNHFSGYASSQSPSLIKQEKKVYRIFYVDSIKGNDNNNGLKKTKAFRTIQRAQKAVKSINKQMTGDIHIVLSAGTYKLSQALLFESADSGFNGYEVIYRSQTNENVVLDGGAQISQWKCIDSVKRIYQAKIEKGTQFRQLYINGKLAIRARTPNAENISDPSGYLRDEIIFKRNKRLFLNDQRIPFSKGMEIVFIDHWKQKRVKPIGSIDLNGRRVWEFSSHTLQHPFFDIFPQDDAPCFYENAYNFLDAPYEWYLDSNNGYVYMIPLLNSDPNYLKVVRPVSNGLIKFVGHDKSSLVKNIVIDGLKLTNVNYVTPNDVGYISSQSRRTIVDENGRHYIVPGSVTLQNAEKIVLNNLYITHSGAHAIVANSDVVRKCIVQACTIENTAGGGIYFNLDDQNSVGNQIKNCTIRNIGKIYSDVAAILFTNTPYVNITNNLIEDCPYTGISLGWSWNDERTSARDAIIESNIIQRVMELHDDGGGIYTLGRIPGTVIKGNYISDIQASSVQGGNDIAAIYLDQGSRGKRIINNVIEDCPKAVTAKNSQISANYFEHNWYDCRWGTVGEDNTVSDNIKVSFGTWDKDALDIIKKAGID